MAKAAFVSNFFSIFFSSSFGPRPAASLWAQRRNLAALLTNSSQVTVLGSHMPVEQGEAASPAVMALRQRLSGFETEHGRLSGLDFQ
jgi:hypothetical protein